MRTRIALYITTLSFTPEHLSALLQTFDTAQTEYPLDPFPDYIRPRLPFPDISPASTSQPDGSESSTPASSSTSTTNWALGLSSDEIWTRHTAEWRPPNYAKGEWDEWARSPIVVVDERTVKDGSVLVVDTDYIHDESEEGRQALKGVRFEPVHVPVAVANLEIANLGLGDVSVFICSFCWV